MEEDHQGPVDWPGLPVARCVAGRAEGAGGQGGGLPQSSASLGRCRADEPDPSATADLTAATVSSGSLRNTPNPSTGISIPLFNLYKGLLAVVIVYSFFDW